MKLFDRKDGAIECDVAQVAFERSVVVAPGMQFVVNEEKKEGVPIITLFHEGRARGTLLLWTMQFMNLINLYMLSTWLPTIARGMGMTTTAALMVGTMFQTGGAVGSVAIGQPIQKWGFFGVLMTCFAGAGLMIALIGQPGLTAALLFGATSMFRPGSAI